MAENKVRKFLFSVTYTLYFTLPNKPPFDI